MSKGMFTERGKKPEARNIEVAVGRAWAKWKKLNEFLCTTLKLRGELKFYGVNYGWAIQYAKSGKSVIALYPAKDSFTAQIILNRAQVKTALAQGLSAGTKNAVRRASEFNEGRWVYLTTDGESDIEDILSLVNIRLEVKD